MQNWNAPATQSRRIYIRIQHSSFFLQRVKQRSVVCKNKANARRIGLNINFHINDLRFYMRKEICQQLFHTKSHAKYLPLIRG